MKISCELLSFFVPLGWFTAWGQALPATPVLWIAFVLCTFGLIYSELASELLRGKLWIAFVLCTFGLIYSILLIASSLFSVVNCFRSLYLWVDLQPRLSVAVSVTCCELLSFFVPLGWFTATFKPYDSGSLLWIAFVLCTFGLIYSYHPRLICRSPVVNCFRSLYLWVDLQHSEDDTEQVQGCELLSFFVPLGWFTAGFYLRL